MSEDQQRAELHRTIWRIANELRGAIDGWEFKSYVLGTLFYRYVSESIEEYIDTLQREAGVDNFRYADLSDEAAEEAREQVVNEKGYFILPSQLFCNVEKSVRKPTHEEEDYRPTITAEAVLAYGQEEVDEEHLFATQHLNEYLSAIFRSIEASAQGQPSEKDFKGLFGDFLVDSTSLGRTVSKRNELLAKVLTAVADMDLGERLSDHAIDAFGDAYEYLMQMYAANAGKSGGEFFTPPAVSELLVQLASIDHADITTVYDPCCGSGSLLLKFAKSDMASRLRFYGQEINPSTYNLCRINMFLHGINFENFDIELGDTLLEPKHTGLRFDAIVSNPPYSVKWVGEDNPLLINDERFAPAGVLAPKSKADLAFTMHMLHHLSETGVAAIVEFPGVLYRGGAEQKIRTYLLHHNYIDTVIQLPQNLFFGVSIATCIIVLRKGTKRDNGVLFVDASQEFEKEGNKNYLRPTHRQRIAEAVAARLDVQYFCHWVKNEDIVANGSNLSVSSYVEQRDTREVIDIADVNAQLTTVVPQVNVLRAQVEDIIRQIEEEA